MMEPTFRVNGIANLLDLFLISFTSVIVRRKLHVKGAVSDV